MSLRRLSPAARSEHGPLVRILGGVLVLLVCVELALVYFSTRYKVPNYDIYGTIEADRLISSDLATSFGYGEAYRVTFREEMERVLSGGVSGFTIEEAIRVREAILNLGRAGERQFGGSGPLDLPTGIRDNRRLLWGELALLYGYSLESLGFKVRNMRVARSVFDPWDSHSTIDIWDESRGQWVLSDPTFNVSFSMDGEYLSSVQLYKAIHLGNLSRVVVEKGAQTSYQYSYENYYVSYFSLFDNLYYASHIHLPGITRLPPLRFIDPRRVVRLVLTQKYAPFTGEISVHNLSLLSIQVFMPMLILVLTVATLRCWQKGVEPGRRDSVA